MSAREEKPAISTGHCRKTELRNVLAMTFPVVVTTTSRALMDVVDYIMVTGLGAPEAQAALLPAQMIMWSYLVLGLGTVSVISTFTAQSLGRNRDEQCGGYAWQAIYLAALFGAAGAAVIPFLPRVFGLIGHEPAVQAMELAYSQVALLIAGPTIAAGALGWYFIGIHRPWITMWSALEANVVNVAVTYVLMFGAFGIEPMGIAGAAWGTLAGEGYRTLRLAVVLFAPSMEVRFASRRSWRPHARKLWDLIRVGTPAGLQMVAEVVAFALFVNVLVGRRFGTAHLIATGIAWQYMRLAFMPTMGVGQALTSLVGRSIGAGDIDRAKRETRIAFFIILAYMGTLSTLYFLFGGVLIGWFNADAEVVSIGAKIMLCAAVFQLFDSLGITYHCALRGAGDTFWPSMYFIVSSWVVLLGGGSLMVIFVPQWGSLGPWIAASTLIISTALFLAWRWRRGGWMKINLFKDGSDRETPDEPQAEPGREPGERLEAAATATV